MLSYENLLKYNNKNNFFNRELSWIKFNKRVLEEAENPSLPLLDRIKFISIFHSNLDEFYMIRVSGLYEQIDAKIYDSAFDGLSPIEQLRLIDMEVRPLVNRSIEIWNKEIIPQLKENDVHILEYNQLTENEKRLLSEYFKKELYPILTPLAVDPGRPFPYISNLSLNLAIQIKKPDGEKHFARVKIPNTLPRLIQVDKFISTGAVRSKKIKFIWLSDYIKNNLHVLFPGMEILEAHKFRITRDTDIEIQEDEADDLLSVIEENILRRRFGNVVRLEVEKTMPQFMIDPLVKNLQMRPEDVHVIDGPLGMSDIMKLYDLPIPHAKEETYHPVNALTKEEAEDIFDTISNRDILLHHPYHSFNTVLDFIKAAVEDPNVLAIKQTLYRVGKNSPIIEYLKQAAEDGKQVAVLVELKARFDEENNIKWARELEKVGVHVVYGLVGLKTHAKMTLIVRKENTGIKRYVHLGTGNYNIVTSKIYTDLSLLTANPDICDDVTDIFNYLTGFSSQSTYKELFVAPVCLRQKLMDLIKNEIEHAKQGKEARIIMKCNAITDPDMICALYEASNNGVKIDLIIRGVCCLKPGVKGLSENISVRSIVGRFLEHHRIYYFYNNGKESLYLSSADIMERNLNRRVETAFSIINKDIKKHIINDILFTYLKDNQKARILLPDGQYIRAEAKDEIINAQEFFMHLYKNKQ
ncbi:MAG TPA: polyphosphate kinase 1 [Ignavibacteriales bacterium]|nr:polyphosphate kinase 1 [Ignavibacteriales bacterium]HPP33579.1 polyphosphate kinase 1 [Ignavibacteriales bacterium]